MACQWHKRELHCDKGGKTEFIKIPVSCSKNYLGELLRKCFVEQCK